MIASPANLYFVYEEQCFTRYHWDAGSGTYAFTRSMHVNILEKSPSEMAGSPD